MADFRGAIFDVDGVLVDSPHEQAWREGLRQPMDNEWSDIRPQTAYAPERFSPRGIPEGQVRQAGLRGRAGRAGAL